MDVNSIEVMNALKSLEMLGSILEPNREGASPSQVSNGQGVEEVDESGTLPRPDLFNKGNPTVELVREKPWHRLAVILKSAGMTDVEIGKELGVTPAAVRVAWKQPWANGILLSRLHASGDKAMAKLHSECEAAVERLIMIAMHAKNDETRRKANNDILDRKYGRPNQPHSLGSKSTDECTDAELVAIVREN